MAPDAIFMRRAQPAECGAPTGLGLYHFDARCIDARLRDASVIAALDALRGGETMRFYDDRDPLPLLVALERRFGKKVSFAFVLRSAGEVILDIGIRRVQPVSQDGAPV